MSCNRRRERFIPRAFEHRPYSSLPRASYFALDTETERMIVCQNERHAKAISVIKNKAVHSWTRWVPCHQDQRGFQMLDI